MDHTFVIATLLSFVAAALARYDPWNDIACTQYYVPNNCNFSALPLITTDDYDRCGPAFMNLMSRNHFLGASGRRITYKNNKDAYDKIQILPKMLIDVSNNSLKTTVLGLDVDFPIGVSPVAYHQLVNPEGEVNTVRGLSDQKTVMILSMYSNRALEDVAGAVQRDGYPHLWMQTYLFQNRTITQKTIKRAEKAGFKALVMTADAPILGTVTCNSRLLTFPPGIGTPNTDNQSIAEGGLLYATFDDIAWLKSLTKLPIVAKGILTGDDAVNALKAGASAILVSNHGGRQLDGVPATIDALPAVVEAVRKYNPNVEVYMDGGVRSGKDVYKALARGAHMAFVGRPSVWGLAIKGSQGVREVMNNLKDDLNQTMILVGAKSLRKISADTLLKPADVCNS